MFYALNDPKNLPGLGLYNGPKKDKIADYETYKIKTD